MRTGVSIRNRGHMNGGRWSAGFGVAALPANEKHPPCDAIIEEGIAAAL